MRSDEYHSIFFYPPFGVIFILGLVLCVLVYYYRYKIPLARIICWSATSLFSDIFKEKKKKTGCPGETKWLFKDINLTAQKPLLFKVQVAFLTLCFVMFGLVLQTFWQFLVWEASYDCDEDDPTKDCFELKSSSKRQDPLNCSSAAVQHLIQNGTIQVICHKIVFNLGLATGISYSSFKLLMFVVEAGTGAILMIKTERMLLGVRVSAVVLFLITITPLIVVSGVIPSTQIFFFDHWDTILQITATEILAIAFLCYIPWWKLICLKTLGENQQDTQASVSTQTPLE